MKKLISLSILAALLLTGCGTNQAQTVPQPTEQQDDNDEMGWFEDEVLDMDDWGEKKKSKVKSGVLQPQPKADIKPQPKAEVKPKSKVDAKMPSTKQKASVSKKNL